jgi:hypothetical protein
VPYPKGNPTQYWFSSRSLPLFTMLADVWYVVNEQQERIKVVPTDDYLRSISNILLVWL